VFMKHLDEAGYNVTGIDLSPDMLEIARTRVKGNLLQMDMRNITLPGVYDAVLCLGSSFTYMQTEEDVDMALSSFNRMLPDGGVLIFDNLNAELTDVTRHSGWQESITEFPDMVIKRRFRNIDWTDDHKKWTTEWRYEITKDGETTEFSDYSRLRAFDQAYLVRKLGENGFKYLKTLEKDRLRLLAVKN
jgi:SAM-dependent methyltransferase